MTNSKTADKLPVTAKTGMPHSVLSVALLSITLLTGCAEKMAHEKTAPKAEQAVQSHPQHHAQLNEVLVSAPSSRPTRSQAASPTAYYTVAANPRFGFTGAVSNENAMLAAETSRDEYESLSEPGFKQPNTSPLSTFSVDVDTASYSNVRRYLTEQRLPPADAVRLEELVNYFDYKTLPTSASSPIAISAETTVAPWNKAHQLAMIQVQAHEAEDLYAVPNKLIFLVDVSGSMGGGDKLPLLKKSFMELSKRLSAKDSVAIVSYASGTRIELSPTAGDQYGDILAALDKLEAEGMTAGSNAIELAYSIAKKQFDPKANNRIILATDGDFNLGPSSTGELVDLVETQSKSGIYLTVLGFGRGNLQDHRMHRLADHGNGNYYYIDSLAEGRRVLGSKLTGTLHTAAQDTKIQVEFNPQTVSSYRLLGYETKRLTSEDFTNDDKDAGEMGAGQQMIALYEIVPKSITTHGNDESNASAKPLRYQEQHTKAGFGAEWLKASVRYKLPNTDTVKSETAILSGVDSQQNTPSEDLLWAGAVAELALILKNDSQSESASIANLLSRLKSVDTTVAEKAEFVYLAVKTQQLLEER